MRQSRKEQDLQRISSMLLRPGTREDRALARCEAAEEWENKPAFSGRNGRLS